MLGQRQSPIHQLKQAEIVLDVRFRRHRKDWQFETSLHAAPELVMCIPHNCSLFGAQGKDQSGKLEVAHVLLDAGGRVDPVRDVLDPSCLSPGRDILEVVDGDDDGAGLEKQVLSAILLVLPGTTVVQGVPQRLQ